MKIFFDDIATCEFLRVGPMDAVVRFVDFKGGGPFTQTLIELSIKNSPKDVSGDLNLLPLMFTHAMMRLCNLLEPILSAEDKLESPIRLNVGVSKQLEIVVNPLFDKQRRRWMVDFEYPTNEGRGTQTWNPDMDGSGEWSAVVGVALAWPFMTAVTEDDPIRKIQLQDFVAEYGQYVESNLRHPYLSAIADKLPKEFQDFAGQYVKTMERAKEIGMRD